MKINKYFDWFFLSSQISNTQKKLLNWYNKTIDYIKLFFKKKNISKLSKDLYLVQKACLNFFNSIYIICMGNIKNIKTISFLLLQSIAIHCNPQFLIYYYIISKFGDLRHVRDYHIISYKFCVVERKYFYKKAVPFFNFYI